MITYEYPLNERIRTLLRLEDLFERSRHFIALPDPHSTIRSTGTAPSWAP